jgi:hypothetical protein
MKTILQSISIVLIYSLIISNPLSAQSPQQDLEFVNCGTPEGKIPWLQEYQRDPSAFQAVLASRANTTTYLPLTFHVVGTDDSLGMAPLSSVLGSFCKLNQDFSATGIQFYIKPPIRFIYNSDFHSHDSVHIGGTNMLNYNIDSTINVYFVAAPGQGNCGYNLPYAGVAMSNNCLSGHTFAHELGHALALPHTFLGWEGGQSWNGAPQQSFTSPAPTEVTINYTDFKDTQYLDTLIIDTVLVEYVTRAGANANCHIAADGFCDTPADYLAYRWVCNQTTGLSTLPQLDPDSVSFTSDGWYIMSYAQDYCQVGFSQEQINAMLSFVTTEKPELLGNPNPFRDTIDGSSLILLEPAAAEIIDVDNPSFRWTAVPNATQYLLQIYRQPMGGGQIVEEVIVSDTFYQSPLTYPTRPDIFPYAWRVMPFNYGYTCEQYSSAQSFNTDAAINVEFTENKLFGWEIFPNPSTLGTNLQISIASDEGLNADFSIYNAQGQRLWSQAQPIDAGKTNFQVQIPSFWAAGLYFVELRKADGRVELKKLILK